MTKSLVFDIETVPDVDLITRAYGFSGSPQDVVDQYIEKLGCGGFIPATLQMPIAICTMPVNSQGRQSGAMQNFATSAGFWKQLSSSCPPARLVSYNGRRFDIPVLEMGAFRQCVPATQWFNPHGKSWEQSRNRYNINAHWDCMEFQTGFGAGPCNGGMHVLAIQCGVPGKIACAGGDVWEMYLAGDLQAIIDYCFCDVITTYLIYIRQLVLCGDLGELDEIAIRNSVRARLAQSDKVWCKRYIEEWDRLK